MKKLLAVLFVPLMTWTLCVSAKDWKVIRFGVDPSYPPFESKAPDGRLIGFDIDLGEALCAKLNAKCIWVENDYDGMIPALQARKIDAILSDMSVTEKRLQQIDFTEKISYSPTRMVAKTGSNLLPTAESLRGKNIGVEQGTIQETYAKTYLEPNGVNLVVIPESGSGLCGSEVRASGCEPARRGTGERWLSQNAGGQRIRI